jgi:lipid II isoglutaminyl synthase (glutamine-hydrolysing)
MGKLPLRARLATTVAGAAGRVSRLSGRGDGSVIGGVVGLRMEPDLLRLLAADRQIVLVTGTNGKTTTTRLITAALGAIGQDIASNAFGANMEAGLISALGRAPDAPFGVLEVDERHLPAIMRATGPRVIALLNLSRDQMDRAAEIWLVARRWREALAGAPGCHVVANADDPLIAWAAAAAQRVTWVAGGQRWHEDSWCCPECGSHLRRDDLGWRCGECGFARPATRWVLDDGSADVRGGAGVEGSAGLRGGAGVEGSAGLRGGAGVEGSAGLRGGAGVEGTVVDSGGRVRELSLTLPGRANRSNAVIALAVAELFGVDMDQALPLLRRVTSVAGRYTQVERGGRMLRLLLAKNPAGWLEAFDVLAPPPTPVLLAVNAQGPDGKDTSWLWDVDYRVLRGRPVLVAGERRLDLAVRLEADQVAFELVGGVDEAVDLVPPGGLDVIANYTAFQQIRTTLGRAQ